MSLFDKIGLGVPDPPDHFPSDSYQELRPTIQDLDVLLWMGTGKAGNFIRWGTRSWASHVSLGYRAGDNLLNFESTTLSKTPDWFTKGSRSGGQVNALSERLRRYPGRVFVRHLKGPRTRELIEEYHRLRRVTSGIAYERNWLQFLGAGIWFIANREDRSSLFCSELVAWVFQELEIVEHRKPSNEYAPEAFTEKKTPANGARVAGGLFFMPGWSLGPTIEIEPPLRQRERIA